MKKLLLLGGAKYMLPVIEAAHKLGIYVITCDYLPDNIAHKYSDEYANISIVDKDAVLDYARNKHIDGIMSFACDPGVVTGAYVAEKLGLPYGGSYESVSILQNKGRFREFLAKHGFNVPKARSYSDVKNAVKDAEYFTWPVIVKPVDSAGSKGVTKVKQVVDLEQAANYALQYSLSKQFIVEEFIEKHGCSSDTDSFSVDGKLVAVTFSAQRFDEKANNPYAPMAYSWPSTFSKEKEEELTNEIQRLLTLLDMKSSIYNIETRVGQDGKAYIMEVSPRGGGNRLAEMIRYSSGVDLITASVQVAVGLPVTEVKPIVYNECWAEYVLHTDKEGTFKELVLDEKFARENVIEQDLWVKEGEQVHPFTGANFAIGTLVLKFKTQNDLGYALEHMDKFVRVIVE